MTSRTEGHTLKGHKDSLFEPSDTTDPIGSSQTGVERIASDRSIDVISGRNKRDSRDFGTTTTSGLSLSDRDTICQSSLQISQGGTKTPGVLEEVARSRSGPVGPVCSQGGILSRVSIKTKTNQSSSVEPAKCTSSAPPGNSGPASERRLGRGSKPQLSRVLQQSLPGTKARQQMEACDRLKKSKSVSDIRKGQNGVSSDNKVSTSGRNVDLFHRSEGRVLSHPNQSDIQEIYENLPSKQGISIHFPTFQSVNGSQGVYKGIQTVSNYAKVQTGHATSVPGRLAGEKHDQGMSDARQRPGPKAGSRNGVHCKWGEIGASPNSALRVCRSQDLVKGLVMPDLEKMDRLKEFVQPFLESDMATARQFQQINGFLNNM